MVLPFPTPAPSPIKNPALSPLGRNVSCCCRTKNKNLYSFSRIHHCKSSSTNKPKKHPTGWDQQASQPNSPWQHEEVFLYRVWVWLLYVLLIPISFPQCQELVDMNAAATNRFIFIVLKLSTAFQSYKTKMITALCKEAFFCQSPSSHYGRFCEMWRTILLSSWLCKPWLYPLLFFSFPSLRNLRQLIPMIFPCLLTFTSSLYAAHCMST